MTRLHIHARDIARHDAVGGFARQVGRLATRAGWTVSYWAGHADTFADVKIVPREQFWEAVAPGDVIFFNFSIFDPFMERLAALPNRKLLYFHNITPPELIDPADATTVENCRGGLAQRPLAARFDAIFANSSDSAGVLLDGMTGADRERRRDRIEIIPPFIGSDRWADVPREVVSLENDRRRLLFVGRLVRHKAVMELLEIFALVSRDIPDLALDVVGNPPSGRYSAALRARAAGITATTGAPISVRHGIDAGALKTLYEAATACITLSRHEGFCIPAADAMYFGKPFFHTPVPAITDIVGGAGLVLPFDEPEKAAAILSATLGDPAMLAAAAAVASQRYRHLASKADGQRILKALVDLTAA